MHTPNDLMVFPYECKKICDGCYADDVRFNGAAVARIIAEEIASGLQDLSTYQRFQCEANKVKNKLLAFLVEANLAGKTVAAYGAEAKGNILMNYAGVKPDLLSFICDAAASKLSKFMLGSHIPILAPKALRERKFYYVLILPWNIADEVVKTNEFVRECGCKFVVAVPALRIF